MIRSFKKHVIAALLAVSIAVSASSIALAAPDKANIEAYQSLLKETTASKQADAFTKYVGKYVRYVGTQSYCGSADKWLAFVDMYGVYDGGELQQYMLRQATVQHNARTLPSTTKSATLTINGESKTLQYKKQSIFSFSDIKVDAPKNKKALTPFKLEESNSLSIDVIVKDGNDTIKIPVEQDYFKETSEDDRVRPGSAEVLGDMASAYIDYANKNELAAPDHAVLRMKSYVSNTNPLARSYSWELYLVDEDKLPSTTTLVRYDCDTKKVSIARRELKTYF